MSRKITGNILVYTSYRCIMLKIYKVKERRYMVIFLLSLFRNSISPIQYLTYTVVTNVFTIAICR